MKKNLRFFAVSAILAFASAPAFAQDAPADVPAESQEEEMNLAGTDAAARGKNLVESIKFGEDFHIDKAGVIRKGKPKASEADLNRARFCTASTPNACSSACDCGCIQGSGRAMCFTHKQSLK